MEVNLSFTIEEKLGHIAEGEAKHKFSLVIVSSDVHSRSLKWHRVTVDS